MVSVIMLLTLVGGVTDGILSSGSGLSSEFEKLKNGDVWALKDMMVWNYDWLDPPWDYLKLPLIAMWIVFGGLLIYESAKFVRSMLPIP